MATKIEAEMERVALEVLITHLEDGIDFMDVVYHDDAPMFSDDELRDIHGKTNDMLERIISTLQD